MTPERIQQLIQILWDEVESSEDLANFLRVYDTEIDGDFRVAVFDIVQQAERQGNESLARFFIHVFNALQQIPPQVIQAIQQMPRQANSIMRIITLPASEAEINAEDDAIRALRPSDPNTAYHRAIINLQCAQETCNDTLIMYCTFTLARTAMEYRPLPKIEEAITNFQIASKMALNIGNNEVYAMAQNNLGAIYVKLPRREQEENLYDAIIFLENALRSYTETAFPKEYAMAQMNLGSTYLLLQRGNRDENLRRAIAAYQNALHTFTGTTFPQEYARTQGYLGKAYCELPTGDRVENLRFAITCCEQALSIYTKTAFPKDYAEVQATLAVAYAELPMGNQDENLRYAITCCEQALSIYTKTAFPKDYAEVQTTLGGIYTRLSTGNQDENLRYAITCCEQALLICTETAFPGDYARAQMILGGAYAKLPTGDRDENQRYAMAACQNALRIFTEAAFPREYAMTQTNLGIVYSNLPTGSRDENLRRAIIAHQNALNIFTEKTFPQLYATTQVNLGLTYAALPAGDRSENLRRAIVCYEHALQIFTEENFPIDYVKAQVNLGSTYVLLPTGDRNENLRRAIAAYQNALSTLTEVAFPKDYAMVQMNLGRAYNELHAGDRNENLRRAITCCENALRICTKTAFPKDYASTQINLGRAYNDLPSGDLDENRRHAITCYENALHVYTKTAFPEDYALTNMNLGTAYNDLLTGDRNENLRRAIASFEQALSVYEESTFPAEYARTQMNLGNAYHELQTGDLDLNLNRAITCFECALHVFTEATFPEDYARTQMNLGNAYSKLSTGDLGANRHRAITCYECALRIFTETTFPEDYARTQQNLGSAYVGLPTGDRAENLRCAITAYNNALRVFGETEFPLAHVGVLQNLAIAYDSSPLNDERSAYNVCLEAIRVLETRVREVSSSETRRAVAETQAGIYHKMVSLCLRFGNIDEAIEYAERGKSRTLVEMLHTEQIQLSENIPKAVRESFLKAREKLNELRYRQQTGERERPRDFEIVSHGEESISFRPIPLDNKLPNIEIWELLNEVQQAYQELLYGIREFDPHFASVEQVQSITIAEIDDLIPEKTLLVECFVGNDGTYLFVLDGKSDTNDVSFALKDLTMAKVLNTLIIRHWLQPYYNYLRDRTAEHCQTWLDALENTSTILAKQFWYAKDEHGRSLAGLVEQSKANRIIFIPHSGLHLLPLHLIPLENPSDSRLIDKYEVTYAPSATLLRFALQRERNDFSNLFAVANPDRSLVFTDGEVHGIAEHFSPHPEKEADPFHLARGKVKILWHEQATKEVVYDQTQDANFIHFSCHGNFQHGNPMESRLLLAGDDGDKKDLTLRDIFARLKLPNASAVVLSACETGMVQLGAGDEYIGLPSGFLYAGTPTVISSLWAVDDLSTSLLMNRWYENVLQNKMGKAAALRDAQLWVRNLTHKEFVDYLEHTPLGQHIDYGILRGFQRSAQRSSDKKPFEHPYYWGAFTCNGSWK